MHSFDRSLFRSSLRRAKILRQVRVGSENHIFDKHLEGVENVIAKYTVPAVLLWNTICSLLHAVWILKYVKQCCI
jgi:hypothetical protein